MYLHKYVQNFYSTQKNKISILCWQFHKHLLSLRHPINVNLYKQFCAVRKHIDDDWFGCLCIRNVILIDIEIRQYREADYLNRLDLRANEMSNIYNLLNNIFYYRTYSWCNLLCVWRKALEEWSSILRTGWETKCVADWRRAFHTYFETVRRYGEVAPAQWDHVSFLPGMNLTNIYREKG